MPSYKISLPDGREFNVDSPVPLTDEQAWAAVQAEASKPSKAKGGFKAAVGAGWDNLQASTAALLGRTGAIDNDTAEQFIAKQRREAAETFKPTEEGWTEAPWTKFKETLGGSLPYMAAPVAAAAGAAALPLTGTAATVAGLGAAGLTSAAQFTGTNLDRQMDEGKALKDTDLGSAAAAAVPQAALDVFALGKIPGIRQLLGAMAKDVGQAGAVKIAQQTAKQVAADYAAATGKAMGVEGFTEAAQQVLERLQAGLELNNPEARKEYWESLVGGAVLGGAISPVGRRVERGQIADKEADQAKAEKAAAIKAAQEARRQEELNAPAPSTPLTKPDTGPGRPTNLMAQPDLFGGAEQTNEQATDAAPPALRKQELAQQMRILADTVADKEKAAAASASPQDSLAATADLKKYKDALTAAKKEHDSIEVVRTPDEQLADVYSKWNKAKELGAFEDVEKYAKQIMEMQANGAKAPPAVSARQVPIPMQPFKGFSDTQKSFETRQAMPELEARQADLLATAQKPSAPDTRMDQFMQDNDRLDSDRLDGAIKSEFDKRDKRAQDIAEAKAEPAPVEYAQKQIRGEGDTEGTRADAKLEDTVTKLTETVVDPQALQLEKQIGDMEDARDQAKAAGREDIAASYQAKIVELQRRSRVNPQNADALATVDRLQKELDAAKKDRDDATATKNVAKAEESARRAAQISDQLAVVQKDPSSLVGRYARAKNDVSMYLSNFFDGAHEAHTENATPRQTVAAAKEAIARYIRAVFREENIRREANNQPQLAGEVRKQFAADTQARADAILKRAMADRKGYREEVVVQPAQMRGNKVVRNAVTEKRDSRALEDRPYAKFAAARAVEEEGFAADRAKVNQPPKPTRVETGVLKRQWQASDEKTRADERGENAKTLTGQQRRRAEYLLNRLDAAMATGKSQGAKDYVEGPLRDALEQYPTNNVMDAAEPLIYAVQTGRMPDAKDMDALQEAVALEKRVAQDDTGQKPLFDDTDTRFERTTPQRFEKAPEVRKGKAKAADAARAQQDTYAMLLREEAKPTTAGEQSMAAYEASLRRREAAVTDQERIAKMDVAVEERMKLDEMAQRLAKLPATRVTKDNESAFAKLIGVGLRKEAAGLERMISAEKAQEKPNTEYITKLEGLLAKSSKAYEQIDSLLPTKIEQRGEAAAVTSDVDDVLQPSKAAVLRDKEEIEGTREKFKRPSQKATESGIASAQKLEEKNKGRGRGPLVVPVTGPRRIRNSGAVKQGTTKQAVDTANKMAHEQAIAAADARIDYLENMQESTAAALARATEAGKKKDIEKWTSHAARVDKALELARGDREFLENADDISSLRGTSGANDTALSDSTIDTLAKDDFAGAVEDIAANSKNPVTRRIAGNIAKLTKNVQVKMVEDMPGDTPDAPGGITADGKKIFINSRTGLSEETVMHEGAHAIVNAKLDADEKTLTKDQLDAKRELEAMHAQIKAAEDLDNDTAKDDDIKEFVAEGLGSKQMQTWMQVQEWTNTTGGNMWQRFKRAILNMLGVKTPPDGKMLDRFLDLSERLMAAPLGEKGSRQADVASFRKQAPSYGKLDGTALADAAGTLMPEQDNASFKDRVLKNAKLVFEMQAVDMRAPVRDALEAIAEAKGDTTDFEQAMYYMRKGDQSSSVIAAVLGNGFPKMDKTNPDARTYGASGGASYMDVMNDIAAMPVEGANIEGKVELATTYLALQRAKSVGFNKLDFAGKVDAAKAAAVDKALSADPELKKALDKVRETYNAYNTGLVQFLADSGAISQQTAKDLLKNGDYMPYYRVDDNGMAQLWLDAEHPIALGEVRHQKHLAELKGGEDRILPLSESIVRNTALLMDKASINLTAKSVAYMLQDAGAGTIKRGKGVAGPDIIRFHQEPDPKDSTDTGERWMRVDTKGTAAEGVPTELLIKGLEGSRVMLPGVLQIMSSAGDLLRAGVTRTPMYLLRQLVRDPMASSFTAGLDSGPLQSVYKAGKEFVASSRGTSKIHADLIEKGLIQHPLFTGDRDDIAKFAKQIAENKTPGPLGKLFQMADGWATQADAATRALVYENAIKNGMSPMQAEMLTMESMNFHKRGMSPSVQFANRAIPFFNAQIQGLNVMWKAMSGQMPYEERLNIQRKFRNNAAILATVGLAYAAAMSDDEYYKRATAKDRLTNFFLHLPGVEEPIKIPIPYEMGYFFSMGVAAVESMRDEADGPELLRAARDMAVGSIPGASSLFLPQLIKPVLEVYTNTSFYTGRGIETEAQKQLSPEQRYNNSTTELAKEISKIAPYLSPIQIEHLVKGYLGILPIAAMASANALFTDPDEATKPASRASDTPLFGSAFQRKAAGEEVSVAYKYVKEAEQAKATYDDLLKRGEKAAAKEYFDENKDTIQMVRLAGRYTSMMAYFKKQEQAIRNSDRTPEEKLEAIDKLADERSEKAKLFVKKFKELEARGEATAA